MSTATLWDEPQATARVFASMQRIHILEQHALRLLDTSPQERVRLEACAALLDLQRAEGTVHDSPTRHVLTDIEDRLDAVTRRLAGLCRA